MSNLRVTLFNRLLHACFSLWISVMILFSGSEQLTIRTTDVCVYNNCDSCQTLISCNDKVITGKQKKVLTIKVVFMYVILWCRNKKVLSLDYKSWMRSLRFETSQTPSIYMYTECDKSFSDAIHGNRPHLTEWWLCVTMTICLCCSSYHFEGKGYFDPAIYIYPTSDNVPRSYLEEKEMECMAKDETIRVII